MSGGYLPEGIPRPDTSYERPHHPVHTALNEHEPYLVVL